MVKKVIIKLDSSEASGPDRIPVVVLKNCEPRHYLELNTTALLLCSVVTKVFKKLVNSRLVDHLEKCDLFLISNMVLGLFDQLQII